MWFVGVGIIAFIVLCVFLYKVKTIPPPQKCIEHTDVSEIFEKAENGDLCFTCGGSYGEKVIRYITGSEFSHVGILFWEQHPTTGKAILYIYDSDRGGGSKDGNRVMPFEQKLETYKSIKIGGWRKLLTKRPTTPQILEHIKANINNTFNALMLDWFLPFKIDENKNFCSELVADVLVDFQILKTQKQHHNFSPGDFCSELTDVYSPLITFDF